MEGLRQGHGARDELRGIMSIEEAHRGCAAEPRFLNHNMRFVEPGEADAL